MKVRYQADADLNQDILTAVIRREPTIDFQTADDAYLFELPDPEVLKLAASEGRVLVSHDQSTMVNHFADFILNATSAGLLIIPQSLPLHDAVEELILIWAASEAEEWVNRISYLPI
jgi:hypothetical protein